MSAWSKKKSEALVHGKSGTQVFIAPASVGTSSVIVFHLSLLISACMKSLVCMSNHL